MASLQPALAALVAQVLETDDVKPQQLLDLVVQQMLDPSDRRVAQHRPSQVVCRDKAHAVALTTSLAAIGVRCGVLTEPPGMPGYISIVSKQLVKAGQAADGAAADRPGRSPCAWCWCGDHAHVRSCKQVCCREMESRKRWPPKLLQPPRRSIPDARGLACRSASC